jgi:hypothetical protein
MQKINWRFVWGLITSYNFARRVETIQHFDRELKRFLEWGADELGDRRLLKWDDVDNEIKNNFPKTRKSILMARDIIKMNGFKIVSNRDKLWNVFRGYLLEYPRPTANDIWVRDHKAEAEEQYRRSVCCLPYDCMHYEHETGRMEIWNNAKDVDCYHIQVRELVEAPAQHRDVFNGDHVVGTETIYVGWTCPDCKETQEQESWFEYYG